jgi:hypothetical protein
VVEAEEVMVAEVAAAEVAVTAAKQNLIGIVNMGH